MTEFTQHEFVPGGLRRPISDASLMAVKRRMIGEVDERRSEGGGYMSRCVKLTVWGLLCVLCTRARWPSACILRPPSPHSAHS